MKLLLDENLPKRLKEDFEEHEIFTVGEKQWHGIKNGELLKRMITENFDVLMTFDKNLQHQQNFSKYPQTVFVLNAPINTYETLTKLSDKIKLILASGNLQAGPVIISFEK